MKYLISALALSSVPLLVNAHEGHGGGSATLHDMHHMLITLGAIGVAALGYGAWKLFKQSKH